MDPLTLSTSLAVGAAGAVAGPLLTRLAHRRALAQPLDVDVAAERRVVGAAIVNPAWLRDGAELTGADFAFPELGAAWEVLKGLAGGDGALPELGEVAAAFDRAGVDVDTGALVDAATGVSRREYVRAGEKVMSGHEDRTTYAGRARTVRADDGSFRRELDGPSRARTAVVTAVTAVACALLPVLAATVFTAGSLAWALASATGVTMVALGVLVSLVDIDTLRIDLGLFAVVGAGCWAGAAAAAAAAGALGRVLVAAAATAAIVGLFEGLNAVHRRLRGIDGQGFGDTLLALVTVGVPVALADDGLLAYWALMVAVVAVLATFVVRRLRGEPAGTAKLNPFGPYLAGSWVLAWAGMAAGVLPAI